MLRCRLICLLSQFLLQRVSQGKAKAGFPRFKAFDHFKGWGFAARRDGIGSGTAVVMNLNVTEYFTLFQEKKRAPYSLRKKLPKHFGFIMEFLS